MQVAAQIFDQSGGGPRPVDGVSEDASRLEHVLEGTVRNGQPPQVQARELLLQPGSARAVQDEVGVPGDDAFEVRIDVGSEGRRGRVRRAGTNSTACARRCGRRGPGRHTVRWPKEPSIRCARGLGRPRRGRSTVPERSPAERRPTPRRQAPARMLRTAKARRQAEPIRSDRRPRGSEERSVQPEAPPRNGAPQRLMKVPPESSAMP